MWATNTVVRIDALIFGVFKQIYISSIGTNAQSFQCHKIVDSDSLNTSYVSAIKAFTYRISQWH